ncbi:GIY-YIG nuclease family protein [Bacteroidota bacterium]
MEYFVYIIYSESHDIYYKGISSDAYHRLFEHNKGMAKYTRSRVPWKLVYLEKINDRGKAQIRER